MTTQHTTHDTESSRVGLADIHRRRRITVATLAAAVFGALLTVLLLLNLATDPIGSAIADASTPDPGGSDSRELGVDDGVIENGAELSPFDDDLPAIANVDPALRQAMQDAARAAIADGFEFHIASGWRSAAYQQSLLNAAVLEYGSVEEADRWVASPEKSKHVWGDAVDIGPTDANSWMSQHGADYGLCQTYANEMWHFELATAPGGACPAQLSDASAG